MKNVYLFFILLALGLLLYAGILTTPFFSDDFFVINRLQQTDFNAVIFFRPLSDASIYLDSLLWGNHAPGFHLTSVLIHAATSFLVYLVATELFNIAAVTPKHVRSYAFISAVLFLAYPFHNEAVVWIVGRGVLLATAFTLLAMYVLLKANGRIGHLVTAALLYGIALSGYESPLLFPVIAGIILVAGKDNARNTVLSCSMLVMALLAYAYIRVHYLGSFAGEAAYFGLYFSAKRLALNLCRLVERSLLPPMEQYIYAILLATGLFAGGVLLYVKKVKTANRFMPAFLCMFAVSLLPVITLGINTHDTEGERFLYFPSFFFIIALVYFIHLVSGGFFKAVAVFCGVFLYFVSFLFISNQHWQKAGAIITSVTSGAASFDTKGTLYVIDLPDNLEGAFIFRNGFAEAFNMVHAPLGVKKIIILSKAELRSQINDTYLKKAAGQRFLIQKDSTGATCSIADSQEHKTYAVVKGDKIVLFLQGRFRIIDCR